LRTASWPSRFAFLRAKVQNLKPFYQALKRQLSILRLASTLSSGHGHTAKTVVQAYGRIGFISVLSAGTTGSISLNDDFFFQLVAICGERHAHKLSKFR